MKFQRPSNLDFVKAKKVTGRILDLFNNTDFGVTSNTVLNNQNLLVTLIDNTQGLVAVGITHDDKAIVVTKNNMCGSMNGFLDNCCLSVKQPAKNLLRNYDDHTAYTFNLNLLVYFMGFLSGYTSVYVNKVDQLE